VEFISSDKYRLLESIFSWEEDLCFLESQPGYNLDIGRRHRKLKRQLACDWVAELQREFEELFHQGLSLLVGSTVERRDLDKALHRLKYAFIFRSALLRLRLQWGLPVKTDIQAITMTFERLIGYGYIIAQDFTLVTGDCLGSLTKPADSGPLKTGQ
jgi:hypothetical protein